MGVGVHENISESVVVSLPEAVAEMSPRLFFGPLEVSSLYHRMRHINDAVVAVLI